jgi:HEPN domain-containing protein
MPANDKTMAVVKEWVTKAENDLKSASYILKMKDCPVDNVCFNAQQCVEKYLKALLITQGLKFPKTHDLGELLVLLPPRLRPSLDN